MQKVSIYGDSLMKATVTDENLRYRFTIKPYLERLSSLFKIDIRNRASFGSSITKGRDVLLRDLENGAAGDTVLLEFGGNDCNYNWKEVAALPEAEHSPVTKPEIFIKTLEEMADSVAQADAEPVLMTLPPIDAEKYLSFIGRDGTDTANILRWLGDCQMIYRFHEMYSQMIMSLAYRRGFRLVDVRREFLSRHNYKELISSDGIHPTSEGYSIVYGAFEQSLRKRITGAV